MIAAIDARKSTEQTGVQMKRRAERWPAFGTCSSAL